MAWMISGGAGWFCLPVSVLIGTPIALIAARYSGRVSNSLLATAVVGLLPGVYLALLPTLPHLLEPHLFPRVLPPGWRFGCRTLGVIPLLLLPVLRVLNHLPAGQGRAAAGLGANTITRFRLLWLPQLGPACLLGLVLAGLVDLAASLRQ